MPFDPTTELSDNVRNRFYIGGNWIESRSSIRHLIVSPATEEALVEIRLADKTDVENAVMAARFAFDSGPWPKMSGVERSVYLRRLSEEIKQRMPQFALPITPQPGSPVSCATR